MKKIISFASIIVMLLGIVIFTAGPAYSNLDHPEYVGGQGGTGTVLWDRDDEQCTNLPKEKTTCTIGGKEQCTAQYCQ